MSATVAQKKIEYFQTLCKAESLAIELYREESATLTLLRKNHEPVRFFDGYATCRAWGKTLEFHRLSERNICEVLWLPWQGNSEKVVKLPIATVLKKAKLDPDAKIMKYFKDQATKTANPAVGWLIHSDSGLIWMGPPSQLR